MAHERRFPFLKHGGDVDKQQILLEKYPLFFRAAQFPETYPSNLAYWGVQCGPGWYPAIDKAAAIIESALVALSQRISNRRTLLNVERILRDKQPGHEREGVVVDEGVEFLLPFCSEISKDRENLRVVIVDGYLCDGETWQVIRHAVDVAKEEASQLCERCGLPGQYQQGYWQRVYCTQCSETRLPTSPPPLSWDPFACEG